MIIIDPVILKTPCQEASTLEAIDIITQLQQELVISEQLGRPGLGLAAPQIGIFKRVAIIRVDNIKLDLINPKIIQGYDQALFQGEGCLSFPGQSVNSWRYQEIVVLSNQQKYVATGLLAVVIQHEIDHLNGILLPEIGSL